MALTENRRLQRVACGLSLTTALVAAPEAQAQDGSPYDLGTLILTGLNLSLTASETGTSVSVVDAQDIARDPGNATVQEAVREVPNVYFPGTTGGPVVRGQQSEGPNGGASAFFAGTVPRFSIAIDGRRAGFNELSFGNASIWDVESIEVYRGPQTTTQGANSIAGAIVVNTKDPTFEREGSLQVSVGSYERQQYSAAFSQAVGEDVALRFSLDHSERDSYVDYDNPNFDPGNAPTRPSNTTGRIKALWAPQEIPGLEVLVGYSYSETEGAQGEGVEEPFKDRENSAVNLAGWRTQVHAATMDATYELGNGLILDNRLVYSDTETRRYVNPGSQGDAWVDQSDLSNDLRLSFGGENTPFRGVAGLYLSRVEGSEAVDLRDFFGGVSDFDDTKESLGLYGEVTYDLTDRFSATGGLRYQQDRVQRDGVVDFLGVVAVEFNETYEALLPSLTLAYDLTDDVTAGFAYSKGMNPGGVSYSFTQGQYVDFDEEIAHNYELFVRGALLDDRLNLSGNLFYTDLRNAQRAVSTRISTNVVEIITVNAEEAVSYGLEVAADYQASDTLMIWGSAGWLKTEFRKFSSAVDDHEGNSFGEAPEFTMTLGASYDVTDRFTVSGDVTHVAGYYSDDLNTDDLKTEAYTLANVQASYTADFGGTFFAYVNNVADIDAATSLSFARGGGAKTASLVAPREFGIGLRYDF